MQGPALTSVTGTTWPSGVNTCVMPIFLPRIPGLIVVFPVLASRYFLPNALLLAKCFNLDVHASRQVELHQSIHRLLRRLENIEQPLMRPQFKLLARFLVHMWRPQNRV